MRQNTEATFYFVYSAIHQGLSLTPKWLYWIGLSDRESEGNFRWVNGEPASSTDDTLWRTGEPDGDGDCCVARFDNSEPADVRDAACSELTLNIPGICERTV